MSYEVVLQSSAQRELDELPTDRFQAIDLATRSLSSNPRPFGAKKLQDNLHRIRVGPWRVVYAVLDKDRRVVILRVERRHERTYRHLPRI